MIEFLEEYPALLAVVTFLARLTDVSMGTLRTILVFRGHRFVAAGIGFVEVLVWVSAAGIVLNNLDQWHLAVCYAGGFATGNVVGSWLDTKLALGTELVRIISRREEVDLADQLRKEGSSVIELAGTQDDGQTVEVLLVTSRRRRVPSLLRRILELDPTAVCTISDVRTHQPTGTSTALSRPPGGRHGRSVRK